VYTDPDPLALYFSIKNGESIPNTQMAYYVLPITAKIIRPFDLKLSDEMTEFANSLAAPLQQGVFPSFLFLCSYFY